MNRAPRNEAQLEALRRGRRGAQWTEQEIEQILAGEVPENRTWHAVQKKLSRLRLQQKKGRGA